MSSHLVQSQSRSDAANHVLDEWSSYKATIRDLYLAQNMRLKDVRQYMLEHHKFEKSVQQYQRILKKWEFTKYIPAAQYREIRNHLRQKRLDAGDASVTIKGKVLSTKRLKREFMRRFPTTLADKWFTRPPPSPIKIYPPIESTLDPSLNSTTMIVRPALNVKFVPFPARNTPWIRFTVNVNKKLANLNSIGRLSQLMAEPGSVPSARQTQVPDPLLTMNKLFQSTVSDISRFSENLEKSSISPTAMVTAKLNIPNLLQLHPKIEAILMEPFAVIGNYPIAAVDSQLIEVSNANSWAVVHLMANNFQHTSYQRNLYDSIALGQWKVLLPLLQAGSSFTTKAVVSQLLAIACRNWDTRLLRRLLSTQVSANSILPSEGCGAVTILQYALYRFESVMDPIHAAAVSDFVSILLTAGADPNKCGCHLDCNQQGKSTVQSHGILCSMGHCCCAALPLGILAHNVKFNDIFSEGGTFSRILCEKSNILKLLLDAGAHLCEKISITRLIECQVPPADLQNYLAGKIQTSQWPATGCIFRSPIQAALAPPYQNIEIAGLLHKLGEWDCGVPTIIEGCPAEECVRAWIDPKNYLKTLVPWRSALTLAFCLNEDFAIDLLQTGIEIDGCYFDDTSNIALPILDFTSRDEEEHKDDMSEWVELVSYDILSPPEDSLHLTALQAAVTMQSLRGLRLLISAGVSLRCCHGTPPLVIAVQEQRYDIVQFLLASGVDPNDDKFPCDVRIWHLSPLAEASAREDVPMMTMLLNAGADINRCDFLTGFTPLQAAIVCGAQSSIEVLLTYMSLDLSHPGSREGIDALTAAIVKQDVNLFQKLVDRVGDPNSLSDSMKRKMLSAATQASNQKFRILMSGLGVSLSVNAMNEIVEALEERIPLSTLLGHDIDLRQQVGAHSIADVLFGHAIENGNLKSAQYVLEQGVDISETISAGLLRNLLRAFKPGDYYDCEVLRMLLICRSWSIWLDGQLILAPLLKIADSASARHEGDKAPQFHAFIDDMLRCGFDLTGVTHFGGYSPVSAAVSHSNANWTRSLLNCGVSANALPNQTFWNLDLAPLQDACRNKSFSIVQLLLEHGSDVNSAPMVRIDAHLNVDCIDCKRMVTALEICCGAELTRVYDNHQMVKWWNAKYQANLACTKMLLRAGADPNLCVSFGRECALTIAARRGEVDIVSELIAYDANINAPAPAQKFAQTALQAASASGNLDVVIVLVNHGADVNAVAGPNCGMTALQGAAIGGYFRIVQILLGAGADIAAPASPVEGRTAIDGAAENGRLDIVKFLLDEYEGQEPITDVCQRAARFARREGHIAVFELLMTYQRSGDSFTPESDLAVENVE